MTDRFPLNISDITDDELRFTSRHLAAAIASLDNAYHFGSASQDLKQHIRAAVMAVERIHTGVNAATRVVTADPDLLRAIADATRSPLPETP